MTSTDLPPTPTAVWVRQAAPHQPAHRAIPAPPAAGPLPDAATVTTACGWTTHGGTIVTSAEAQSLPVMPCVKCFVPHAAVQAFNRRYAAPVPPRV